MKVVETTQATASLGEYAQVIENEPVVITVQGKPIAALVPLENTDLETVSLSTNPEFLAIIERSRLRHQTEGGISSQELRKRLGLR